MCYTLKLYIDTMFWSCTITVDHAHSQYAQLRMHSEPQQCHMNAHQSFVGCSKCFTSAVAYDVIGCWTAHRHTMASISTGLWTYTASTAASACVSDIPCDNGHRRATYTSRPYTTTVHWPTNHHLTATDDASTHHDHARSTCSRRLYR